MRARTRTSRWLERTAWTAVGISMVAGVVSALLSVEVDNSKYAIYLSDGTVYVNLAPWSPYLEYPSNADTADAIGDLDPWSFRIERTNADTILDRLGWELPLVHFYYPFDLQFRIQCWLLTIVCGAMALRMCRGPRQLPFRAARRRRWLGNVAIIAAAGCYCLWYATRDYLDIYVELPFTNTWIHQGRIDTSTTLLEWPDLTIRGQVINLSSLPPAPPNIMFNLNIDSLVGFQIVSFPAWLPAWMFLPFGLWLRRSARYVQTGVCIKCGYDLTGNTSGKCSECGLAIVNQVHGTRQ